MTIGSGVGALAVAPAFGTAVLTLVPIALERLGVPLSGRAGPLAATVLAAASGYLALLATSILRRRS